MKASERRLNLLLLLQSNQNWNVDKFAEYFGVSRRTIFRDFKTFSEIDVPVTYDPEKGYGMMKGYTIPPVMFTPKELSTVMVGLSFVKTQVDKTLIDDARAIEAKLKSVLPNDDLKRFMDTIGQRTIVDPYNRYGKQKRDGGDWFTIGNAIANFHKVEMDYISNSGESERRKVNPYLLAYFSDHWTLIGYCNSRKAIRSFRLERMSNVELLNESFNSANIPVPEKLLYREENETFEIELQVHNSVLSDVRANVPARIIAEEPKGDSTNIIFKFNNLNYLNEWIFTWHSKIKVLKPSNLVELRLESIQKMLKSIVE